MLGLIGDTSRIDMELIASLDIVDSVKRVAEPFKQCSRKFHPDDTVVDVGGVKIGGGHFAMIAGPCSVESREQIIAVAQAVKDAGAKLLRGGAFKPRTSPYSFQGLKDEGIELLLEAKKATGLPIVTEIMNANDLPLFEEVDVIQVGARNMQNFDLLKELGRTGKAILLKRGLAKMCIRDRCKRLQKSEGPKGWSAEHTERSVVRNRRPEGLKARAHAVRSAGTLGRLRRHSAKTSNREISLANHRFVNDQRPPF